MEHQRPVSQNNTGSGRASTPNTLKTTDNQEVAKRCNSLIENKPKFTITSERLSQLRKLVDAAIKDHKIFSIKGRWPIIRRELLKRNYIEKVDTGTYKKSNYQASDDLTSNLPAKQDWESTVAYMEKCENMIMSRMLQNYDVDFYWSMKKEASDLKHRACTYKLINRFSRSLFTSKEGLGLLLQQSYWHIEPGVADVNFPRCYVLGFPDHYNLFVDDFRITAAISLLKWFAEKFEMGFLEVFSPDGQVPFSVLNFAVDRCNDHIAIQKHSDIDKEIPTIWDHEWDQFLTNFCTIVHQKGYFHESKDGNTMYATVKVVLKEIYRYWPEYDIDGMRNIWIVKPGNKCRGRGIQLIKNIEEVDKIMGMKLKYIVQKYIEKPLIIYDTKFDIRQWFMITNVQPLTIWMYKDSYLRFSSQIFSLNNFHESLHLTNHAVQCKYVNVKQRSKSLPEDNMWDCNTFKVYLKQIGALDKWNDVIYPGMKKNIICAMLASQDTMDRRQNTYEIYGADFIISEDFRPWLLEINCSPDMSFSTSVTSKLCGQCMEDIIKVVIDKRLDPKAATGAFELIYKQNLPRVPPYLGISLSIRGRKIFKSRTKSKPSVESDKNNISPPATTTTAPTSVPNPNKHVNASDLFKESTINNILPKLISGELYKGPVIEDLICELKKTYKTEDSGVNFVPANRDTFKKKNEKHKERVSSKSTYNKRNKQTFLRRKRNGSENNKAELATLKRSNAKFLGVFNEWATTNNNNDNVKNNNHTSSDDTWEKETESILKTNTTLFRKDVVELKKTYNLNSYNLNDSLLPNIPAKL